MTPVLCLKCRRDTGFRATGQILYDEQGREFNKAAGGYFLIFGFDCPKCKGKTWWSYENGK